MFCLIRKRLYGRGYLLCLASVLLFVFSLPMQADIITVCPIDCDHSSIGGALAPGVAKSGDTVEVEPGTYQESGLVLTAGVILTSKNPSDPAGTVIDAMGAAGVLEVGRDSAVVGFTIRGGQASVNAGINNNAGGKSFIINCIVEDNHSDTAGGGVGATVGDVELYIIASTIRNNSAKCGKAGISVLKGLYMDGSEVIGNTAGAPGAFCSVDGAAIGAKEWSRVLIRNSVIAGNVALTDLDSAKINGGAYHGPGLIQNTFISNNIITANGPGTSVSPATAKGAGVYPAHDGGERLVVEGGAITGNVAISVNGTAQGGGSYIASSKGLTLKNVVVSGNAAGTEGGGLYCQIQDPKVIRLSGAAPGGNTPDQVVCGTNCVDGTSEACQTGLPGACGVGTQQCRTDGLWGLCEPPPGQQSVPEDCGNGVDDNCNGLTDTDDPQCQVPGSTSSGTRQAGKKGDPVNTFLGELYNLYEPDIDLAGPLPLTFQRYYASRLEAAGRSGRLGQNWRHNYEWSLNKPDSSTAEITTFKGRLLTFGKVSGEWILASRNDVPYQLLEVGGEFILGDPESALVYQFEAGGELTSIQDRNGNTLTLTYTLNDLTQVSDGLGRSLTFTYDVSAPNYLTQVTDDGLRMVLFDQTGDDLTAVSDLRSKVTSHSYAASGLMTGMTRPRANVPYTQVWDAQDRVQTQTNADLHTTTFTYTAGETALEDPQTNTSVHQHSDWGALVNVMDESGNSFTMTYDGQDRRSGIDDRLGDGSHYEYHEESGKISRVLFPDGREKRFDYVAGIFRGILNYEISRVTYPDGTSQAFSYDAAGNMLSRTDQSGNVWQFSYNHQGQMVTTTSPLGGITQLTHHPEGMLASRTDPSNNTTYYDYDTKRRINLLTLPDGDSWAFTYDESDAPLTITDPRGNETILAYDDNGNLASITDREGNLTQFSYDLMDRLENITDSLGNTATNTYNNLGRLSGVTGRAGDAIAFAYDATGWLTGVTDGEGQLWGFQYDQEGVLSGFNDPLSNHVSILTDTLGRDLQVTTQQGLATSFDYDSIGQLTGITNPETEQSSLNYDARGLIVGVMEGSLGLGMVRNGQGDIISLTDARGQDWLQARDLQGRITANTDPLGNALGYSYDSRGRVATITYPNLSDTLVFDYDENGNVIQRNYGSGSLVIGATYDAMDRLLTSDGISLAYDLNGNLLDNNGITVTRTADGLLKSVTYDTGKTVTYTYDNRRKLSQIADWNSGVTTFTYDDAGRLLTTTRSNNVITSNTWDDDSRLTGIDEGVTGNPGALSSIGLTLDGAGRVSAATRNMPLAADPTAISEVTQTFDAASQKGGYSHDDLGRVTDDGVRNYVWDLADRLQSYTEGGGNPITFSYDALGNRLGRTEAGNTRAYIWNYALLLPGVAIEKLANVDQYYYVYAPDGALLYRLAATGGARHYYHFDEAGNTRFLTDDAGAIVASYTYGAFGEPMGQSGVADNPFTYHGRYGVMQEGNSGLYYMRARYYDSQSARFLSRDKLQLPVPRAFNPYQFALNDPLGFQDASGMTPRSRRDTVGRKGPYCHGRSSRPLKDAQGQLSDTGRELGNKTFVLEKLNGLAARALKNQGAFRAAKAASQNSARWSKAGLHAAVLFGAASEGMQAYREGRGRRRASMSSVATRAAWAGAMDYAFVKATPHLAAVDTYFGGEGSNTLKQPMRALSTLTDGSVGAMEAYKRAVRCGDYGKFATKLNEVGEDFSETDAGKMVQDSAQFWFEQGIGGGMGLLWDAVRGR